MFTEKTKLFNIYNCHKLRSKLVKDFPLLREQKGVRLPEWQD